MSKMQIARLPEIKSGSEEAEKAQLITMLPEHPVQVVMLPKDGCIRTGEVAVEWRLAVAAMWDSK